MSTYEGEPHCTGIAPTMARRERDRISVTYSTGTARKNFQFTCLPSLQTTKAAIFHRLQIGVIGADGGRITCGDQVKLLLDVTTWPSDLNLSMTSARKTGVPPPPSTPNHPYG